MKIVYVLVCSEKDFYYEQALVSILSLRHVMPQAYIALLIDDESYDYLQKTTNMSGAEILELLKKIEEDTK